MQCEFREQEQQWREKRVRRLAVARYRRTGRAPQTARSETAYRQGRGEATLAGLGLMSRSRAANHVTSFPIRYVHAFRYLILKVPRYLGIGMTLETISLEIALQRSYVRWMYGCKFYSCYLIYIRHFRNQRLGGSNIYSVRV